MSNTVKKDLMINFKYPVERQIKPVSSFIRLTMSKSKPKSSDSKKSVKSNGKSASKVKPKSSTVKTSSKVKSKGPDQSNSKLKSKSKSAKSTSGSKKSPCSPDVTESTLKNIQTFFNRNQRPTSRGSGVMLSKSNSTKKEGDKLTKLLSKQGMTAELEIELTTPIVKASHKSQSKQKASRKILPLPQMIATGRNGNKTVSSKKSTSAGSKSKPKSTSTLNSTKSVPVSKKQSSNSSKKSKSTSSSKKIKSKSTSNIKSQSKASNSKMTTTTKVASKTTQAKSSSAKSKSGKK